MLDGHPLTNEGHFSNARERLLDLMTIYKNEAAYSYLSEYHDRSGNPNYLITYKKSFYMLGSQHSVIHIVDRFKLAHFYTNTPEEATDPVAAALEYLNIIKLASNTDDIQKAEKLLNTLANEWGQQSPGVTRVLRLAEQYRNPELSSITSSTPPQDDSEKKQDQDEITMPGETTKIIPPVKLVEITWNLHLNFPLDNKIIEEMGNYLLKIGDAFIKAGNKEDAFQWFDTAARIGHEKSTQYLKQHYSDLITLSPAEKQLQDDKALSSELCRLISNDEPMKAIEFINKLIQDNAIHIFHTANDEGDLPIHVLVKTAVKKSSLPHEILAFLLSVMPYTQLHGKDRFDKTALDYAKDSPTIYNAIKFYEQQADLLDYHHYLTTRKEGSTLPARKKIGADLMSALHGGNYEKAVGIVTTAISVTQLPLAFLKRFKTERNAEILRGLIYTPNSAELSAKMEKMKSHYEVYQRVESAKQQPAVHSMNPS
jgi:tetratricopeptide (TPR) repeat protein